MATQAPGIILVQSRALIAAGLIALFGGTIVAGSGFVSLAAATFCAPRFPPAIIFVLVLYAALLIFLCYLDFLCVVAAVRPRTLTITSDGITEVRRDATRSELWKNLSDPTKKVVTSGGAGMAIYLEFERGSSEPFLVRVDIYPESADDILMLVQSAMSGDTLNEIERRSQIGNYFLVALTAVLIFLAIHFAAK